MVFRFERGFLGFQRSGHISLVQEEMSDIVFEVVRKIGRSAFQQA